MPLSIGKISGFKKPNRLGPGLAARQPAARSMQADASGRQSINRRNKVIQFKSERRIASGSPPDQFIPSPRVNFIRLRNAPRACGNAEPFDAPKDRSPAKLPK